ncbi:deoxynucleoside kinase [Acanthopleuribacter pedis]|uniref:Deoxynucleoside kinase n=1 Tax=Acanthopleuribacter pedis TaxID=442870 RepID=A0A8J7QSH4_9BACT|nr:deoxynucleoside kinase [Acanthopleuribacter pedis]MBO1323063.1 deoxynucleoside kinase [Acanthopleuribacter pedis]
MASPYSYIAFEGPLGCEKRSLARLVAKELEAELTPDLVENPFLWDFYKNRNGAAFQAQLFFLLNRFQLLQGLRQPNLFRQTIVTDFIIEKDRIYAYQNLSDSELALYEKLYPMLTADQVAPDLVVYLQMSPEKVLENLRKRKEIKQFNISPEYIENVVEAYNRFFFHYEASPLIIINANHVNFSKDRAAINDLLEYFKKTLRGVTYFTPQIPG